MLTETMIALGAAGGTAVIQAAATDGWTHFKTGLAKVIGRGDPAATTRTEEELDRTHDELAPLEGEVLTSRRRVTEEVWKSKLITFLDQHPEAEAELEELLAQAAPTTNVTINATARDNAKQAVLGQGTQTNNFS
jgi:hypothetical protein